MARNPLKKNNMLNIVPPDRSSTRDLAVVQSPIVNVWSTMIYVARIWSLVETPDEIFAGNNIFLFVSFEGNFISSLISLEKLRCREELDYLSKTGRRRSYRYLWQTLNASSTGRVLNRTVSPYTAALFSHGNSLDDTPELT